MHNQDKRDRPQDEDPLQDVDELTDEVRARAIAAEVQPRIARLQAAVTAACQAGNAIAASVWQADGADTLDALSAYFETRTKLAQTNA